MSEPTWVQSGLRVFSSATGRVVGRIRSITARELVLGTEARIAEGRTMMLSMVLPQTFDGANTASVMARCIRCYGHEARWMAEFEYVQAPPETLARFEALSHFLIRNAAMRARADDDAVVER